MSNLGAVQYDPSTADTHASTASLLAMTAFDTTNLRLTFTAPSNGSVLVKVAGSCHGAATFPQVLVGVLEGSTVMGRVAPVGAMQATGLATQRLGWEATFVCSGLTPGSHTWDAAYAVQAVVASTAIKYGGPNDTTTDNAWGAITFEVWECPNLIKAICYDPSTLVASTIGQSLQAVTAVDTTNLRIAFNAPPSGKVFWRQRFNVLGASGAWPQLLVGVLESSTVVARRPAAGGALGTSIAATRQTVTASGVITGLTSGSAHTYDAALGVEVIIASSGVYYGGPNDAAGADAGGGYCFEVWAA